MYLTKRISRARWAGALALFTLAACGGESTAPPPAASIAIDPVNAAVYAGDAITMRATVRSGTGVEVPGAQVSWSVSDPSRAELGENGSLIALKEGSVRVTATYQTTTATLDLVIQKLSVLQVNVLPAALQLSRGDVAPLGVHLVGAGGRTVTGRAVSITSDNPAIATIDASGRVRAVSEGSTTIRATADGVTGTALVTIEPNDTRLSLSRFGGQTLPHFVLGDSVSTDGVREYHEIYVEGGTLRLSGGARPRYEIDVRYAEYNVRMVNGAKTLELRYLSREYDRGIVDYDARGDLAMTSEYVWPLSHVASPLSGGVQVQYRIPGSDEKLDLFYRREPR